MSECIASEYIKHIFCSSFFKNLRAIVRSGDFCFDAAASIFKHIQTRLDDAEILASGLMFSCLYYIRFSVFLFLFLFLFFFEMKHTVVNIYTYLRIIFVTVLKFFQCKYARGVFETTNKLKM